MTPQDIIDYCTKKEKAEMAFPFGEIPICFKLYNRIFLELYPNKMDYKITVTCELVTGDFLRQVFNGIVVHGYHCPAAIRPYRNTVYLDNDVLADEQILEMIDTSYYLVAKKLKKADRETLAIFRNES